MSAQWPRRFVWHQCGFSLILVANVGFGWFRERRVDPAQPQHLARLVDPGKQSKTALQHTGTAEIRTPASILGRFRFNRSPQDMFSSHCTLNAMVFGDTWTQIYKCKTQSLCTFLLGVLGDILFWQEMLKDMTEHVTQISF